MSNRYRILLQNIITCSNFKIACRNVNNFVKRSQNVRLCIRQAALSHRAIHNTYLVDEASSNDEDTLTTCNKFTQRTYNCGELRIKHIGENVILCGWLEYRRLNKFVVLRDGYGHTQLLINDSDEKTLGILYSLPYESIIQISGTVQKRPSHTFNKNMVTGEIEVLINSLSVLNKAQEQLPFNIREYQKAKEPVRMQYRYLDLRFPEMQRNLRVRSDLIMAMRRFLHKYNFIEVETPSLFKATPGGAQEFVVPTRFPGEFYSLVQSPQQFKQMLMAGAIDRYYQIARCYRDEGSRSDRQPEFTQLDIEMSFTDSKEVIALIEELLGECWPNFLSPLPKNFVKMTYKDAIELYGTDKPDLRFEFKITDCTSIVKSSVDTVETDFGSYAIFFMSPYDSPSRHFKHELDSLIKSYGDVKCIQAKAASRSEWMNKLSKSVNQYATTQLVNTLNLQNKGVLFLAWGVKKEVLPLLGKIRVEYANYLEKSGLNVKKEGMYLAWIVDFPLFERNDKDNGFKSVHHPFTAPHPDDLDLLTTAPLLMRAQAYDLVLNGNEIGGGSIRIHDATQQERILKVLNINKETMPHMLDMLRSGCPPHGGIALGLDRLFSILLQTKSIRDVIAFPKTFEGRDPVSGAPSPISKHDQRLYHINIANNHD